ncbi:TrmO family methyltransferase domain-containing protein [Pyrococcus abyssi]|nr:TrmO family methyltransferase [Pyrococcus abyssi]
MRIKRIEGNEIYIDEIDAFDGTPVLDIKIFVKHLDCI